MFMWAVNELTQMTLEVWTVHCVSTTYIIPRWKKNTWGLWQREISCWALTAQTILFLFVWSFHVILLTIRKFDHCQACSGKDEGDRGSFIYANNWIPPSPSLQRGFVSFPCFWHGVSMTQPPRLGDSSSHSYREGGSVTRLTVLQTQKVDIFHSVLFCLGLHFCLHTLTAVKKNNKKITFKQHGSFSLGFFFVFIRNHAFNHDGSMLTIMEISSAAVVEGSQAAALFRNRNNGSS